MILHYYGLSAFRLSSASNDVTVLLNPFEQSSGWKMPRVTPDIVLYSDSTRDEISLKTKDGHFPFIVKYPGEYEVQNIFIYGVGVDAHTTLFVLGIDDLYVGYLGGINRTLTEKELDALGRIDVLLLPVGDALRVSAAVDVIGQIEPRIVIPMSYKLPGLKGDYKPVTDFLKEYGIKDSEELDKLKLTKKDLPSTETKVIVLKPV